MASNKPGDKCEKSGIYKVEHDPGHAQSHEVNRPGFRGGCLV